MQNVNKVKLLSERTSVAPPVIFDTIGITVIVITSTNIIISISIVGIIIINIILIVIIVIVVIVSINFIIILLQDELGALSSDAAIDLHTLGYTLGYIQLGEG